MKKSIFFLNCFYKFGYEVATMEFSENEVYLLQSIADGNQAAFSELYNTYWAKIFKRIYAKVNDQEAAEDISHDLFLSIWKNRQRVTDILNIEAYLTSGARYLTYAYLNKKSQQANQVELENIDLFTDETSIEDILHYRYLLDLIQEEIENLPTKCKLIFKESRENHKTIAQIAAEFNISTSTVENQINKALKKIKSSISNFNTFYTFF